MPSHHHSKKSALINNKTSNCKSCAHRGTPHGSSSSSSSPAANKQSTITTSSRHHNQRHHHQKKDDYYECGVSNNQQQQQQQYPRTPPTYSVDKNDNISLGKYRIFVFPHKLHWLGETAVIPHRKGLLVIFVASCIFFFIHGWFAPNYAGRPFNHTSDSIMFVSTVICGFATLMTDPGILPPMLEPEGEDEDEDEEQSSDDDSDDDDDGSRSSTGNNSDEGIVSGEDADDDEEHSSSSSPRRRLMKKATSKNKKGEKKKPTLASSSSPPPLLPSPPRLNTYLQHADANYARCPVDELSHCKHCDHLRPKKTSHCPKCGVCITNFDHHCGFLQTDIGGRNMRWFVLFTCLSVVCVIQGAMACAMPLLFDPELVENAPRRAPFVLQICTTLLCLWAIAQGFMVANYVLMLFVPGFRSTKEMWRSWCGKRKKPQQQQDAAAAAAADNDDDGASSSTVKFWRVFTNIPPSLLPKWSMDLLISMEDDDYGVGGRHTTRVMMPV